MQHITTPPPAAGHDNARRHHNDPGPPPPPHDTPTNGTIPTTLDPEQALLGALLLTPAHAAALADELEPADFDQPRHETIWTAIHTIAATGAIPDAVTVSTHLAATGQLRHIGGPGYLPHLLTTTPGATLAQALHYATIIRDHARLTAADTAATRIHQAAATGRIGDVEHALAAALDTIDAAATRFGPATHTPTHTNLSWLLTGTPPHVDPPAWGQRDDDAGHLFYPGRVNGIYGDPEAAKSWLAQYVVVEALTAGQSGAIIDVDHNGPQLTTERLLLLGATPTQLANPTQFRYYTPDDASDLRAAVAEITTFKPAVAILDSIGEMMPMLGIKSVDNDELTGALRTIASAIAAAGTCVITIDHLPKSADARKTGFAIGGTAKKRAIDGSYIHAEARTAPAPGQIGRITLRIEKDRPGRLRAACTGTYVGTFTLDSTKPHTTIASIGTDGSPLTPAGVVRPTHLMEAISRYVEANDQASFRDIKAAVVGKDRYLRAAIARLDEEGYLITFAGRANAVLHHVNVMYREDEDDT
ncbi:MAG: DnaB-like helicase N-terminal domain-containing protein [Nocardioidaceae bacterium]